MKWNPESLSLAKRIVALSAMVAALVLVVTIEPATAAPCREVFRDYYEEPQLINWCGYSYNLCNHIYREGCQTSWYTIQAGDCCGGGGGPLCDC